VTKPSAEATLEATLEQLRAEIVRACTLIDALRANLRVFDVLVPALEQLKDAVDAYEGSDDGPLWNDPALRTLVAAARDLARLM
jgi:hypothetical protein